MTVNNREPVRQPAAASPITARTHRALAFLVHEPTLWTHYSNVARWADEVIREGSR